MYLSNMSFFSVDSKTKLLKVVDTKEFNKMKMEKDHHVWFTVLKDREVSMFDHPEYENWRLYHDKDSRQLFFFSLIFRNLLSNKRNYFGGLNLKEISMQE